ncbi:YcxB family protein [Alloalcanivorax sp. C16-1]|uniref:YcxB family protein n=1 Tax=Alloalcanivorax sp. C16-1 TaxID=3390051 RepID=UPI00397068A0
MESMGYDGPTPEAGTVYRVSREDYIAAGRLFARPTRKLLVVSASILGALAVVAFCVPATVAGAIVGGMAGWVLFFSVVMLVVTPRMLGRHYDNYKSMQEEISVELKDEGVLFSTEDGGGLVRWDSLHKWRQNDRYILILIMPKLYYVVPKSLGDRGFDIPRLLDALKKNAPEIR